MISKPINEYRLVDKSGASTRGTSSTNSNTAEGSEEKW